jgi:prepilin-type processing-associated H-X9-DG protein
MYCSKCGAQNSDGSTHCSNCGSVLTDIIEPATGQSPSAAITTNPKTCGLAVAAFVMGLLSVLCITWPICGPLAIIFGIIALVKISKNKPYLKGTGMAVTGIVIPAVMIILIPVIAMLMAIMMPALAKTKMIAQRVVCGTNLKCLSTAMVVYMNDYNNEYPTPEAWCDLLIQEVDVSPDSFHCPEDAEEFSYAINKNIYDIEPGLPDAQIVMLFESDLGRNGAGGPEDLVLRHDLSGRLGCNIAFVDGHVEFVPEERIADLKWTAE